MSPDRSNLYQQVVHITYEYLGPAADRFVARQIRLHLDKEPTELQPNDLRGLIDWIRLAMNILSDDERVVNIYVADLERLAREPRS